MSRYLEYADTDFDVRLQDVPLNNRRPDVTVYRAETIDVVPTRPEHVLLVVEVVSPGSEQPTGSSRLTNTTVPFHLDVDLGRI